jgi:glycosyltransferase involved in cell wall biosynthesis
MKITLLHYAAPPVVGGVESVIGHHARLMADDGRQVTILAGRGGQSDLRIPFLHLPEADSRHPEVLAVKAELDVGRVTSRFESLVSSLLAALGRLLAGVDVVVAHNVGSLNKNLALTAALQRFSERTGAPRLVLWHHDLAWTTPRYRDELYGGYPWDLLRTAWPGALQVTISEARRQELAGLLRIQPEHIQVVPNGVDVAQFLKLEPASRSLLERLDLLSASPLLLLPVRITERKNIELAIRTLAVLRSQFPAARLVVTGPLGAHNPANTDYFRQLTALRAGLEMQEGVVFLAEVSDEILPDAVIADLYRLADALFLPSREEGFGIPLLEAGLAGLPVFCADIPPLRELGGAFASYFAPDANPYFIAALIRDTLAHDRSFGLRQLVKKDYTWSRIYTGRIRPLLDA